ncbi:MAG: hypothetical protein ACE37H_18335 [Phycisphaeraceae bacterium]
MPHRLATRCLAALCLVAGLTACQAPTQPIPTLDPQGDVYKTEGPNDPLIYDDALGTKKVIIVYADFPDRKANHSTQERAAKVLGGTDEQGTFQQIFKTNSYGKLTLDITHVHGWRTMPESHQAYDPVTTEGHREMFVQAFKLYPDINFLDYDYAIVLMTAKGNFAFGERPDEAIPYRGEKITVALNQGSHSPYTLAHELAHCMGLPDLYTYTNRVPEGTPKNPLGPWDIMSGPATGFLGWHRHKLGWLDDDRKTYLADGTHTLTLTPINGDAGVSMVAIPAVGEDPAKPSKVYIIERAEPIRVKDADQPKPAGVLIYSVDAKLPTGQNPVVVHFGEGKDKVNAAYHEGETFDQGDAPMSVNVLKKNKDGSYEIEVVVKSQAK